MREKRPKERHAKINFQNFGSPPVGLPPGTDPVTFIRDSRGNISAYVDTSAAGGLTLAAGKLAGRGSSSGTGSLESISIGTGLSMSGTTLNASGGGNAVRCFGNTAASGGHFIDVPSNAAFNIGSPSKFTVRCWFRPGSTSNTNNGIATRSSLSSSQGDWAFGFFNGATMAPTLRVNNNAANVQSATVLGLRWYFLEASYDSSLGSNNLKLFIDGVLNAQANYSTVISNNAVGIALGTYFDNAHAQLGYISEFEFCAGVVRNASNYTPPSTITPDGNTTILWKLNDDVFGQPFALDSSGNGFNGTLETLGSTFFHTAVRFI